MQAEAVLDAEESNVHVDDLREGQIHLSAMGRHIFRFVVIGDKLTEIVLIFFQTFWLDFGFAHPRVPAAFERMSKTPWRGRLFSKGAKA